MIKREIGIIIIYILEFGIYRKMREEIYTACNNVNNVGHAK